VNHGNESLSQAGIKNYIQHEGGKTKCDLGPQLPVEATLELDFFSLALSNHFAVSPVPCVIGSLPFVAFSNWCRGLPIQAPPPAIYCHYTPLA
jgi:hypothetical protein